MAPRPPPEPLAGVPAAGTDGVGFLVPHPGVPGSRLVFSRVFAPAPPETAVDVVDDAVVGDGGDKQNEKLVEKLPRLGTRPKLNTSPFLDAALLILSSSLSSGDWYAARAALRLLSRAAAEADSESDSEADGVVSGASSESDSDAAEEDAGGDWGEAFSSDEDDEDDEIDSDEDAALAAALAASDDDDDASRRRLLESERGKPFARLADRARAKAERARDARTTAAEHIADQLRTVKERRDAARAAVVDHFDQ